MGSVGYKQNLWSKQPRKMSRRVGISVCDPLWVSSSMKQKTHTKQLAAVRGVCTELATEKLVLNDDDDDESEFRAIGAFS